MRLLNTSTLEFHEYDDIEDTVPKYAILSHTWGLEEVTFQDMQGGDCSSMIGYAKIKRFCKRARDDEYKFAWVDTCCIDKTSSEELSKSLNSMFKWYENAEKCYTYLKDVLEAPTTSEGKSQFKRARWFSRGWCLQELLASTKMDFFDANWNPIGTKSSLASLIEERTGIRDLTNWRDACIAVKFSWAAGRETKFKEDIAYSLLGIFGVNLVPIYGEGIKAFQRLQLEILQHSDDESIFAWSNSKNDLGWGQGFLASSPTAFHSSGHVIPVTVLPPKYLKRREYRKTPLAHRYRSVYTMTNKGLQMTVPIIQWRISAKDPIVRNPSKILKEIFLVPIFCTTSESPNQNWIGIMVRRVRGLVYARIGIRLLENKEQAYFMGNTIPYWSKTLFGALIHYRADFGQLSKAPWTILYSEQYSTDDGPFKDRVKIACDSYEGIGPLPATKPR